MSRLRIYLDNAATSWPKPETVYDAVDHYQREWGAPAGRSAYSESVLVDRAVADARNAVARLIGAADPRQIVFTYSGTDALNLAIHGLLKTGDHVVTTVCEHNSVLRPLRHLATTRQVDVTYVGCDEEGIVDPHDVLQAVRPHTRLVALVHASNVTGALQPVEQVGQMIEDHGALFLVDAAQTLGHRPVHVRELHADLLAAPGHKGLLGPLGTGLLYLAPGLEADIRTVRQGGTGTQSEDDHQPDSMPDKYEAGNHNVVGILGLAAGLAYLEEAGIEVVCRHVTQVAERLIDGLHRIRGVTLYGPSRMQDRVGVVSIQIDNYDPQEVAATLDAAYRIQVRAGLHCAPRMHEALDTISKGGTVRFSPGPFTAADQIDQVLDAIQEISSVSFTG